jgi:peptidoglycan/LPS O-acetylase OafA/YrhL
VLDKTIRSGYIDQWRGLSVLAVIASHLINIRFSPFFAAHHGKLIQAVTWRVKLWGAYEGMVGVDIFFVISGYLITSLLLREEVERGSVSLAAFYARRATRIWPAMLAYIVVVLLLGLADARDAAIAVSFTCNTSLWACSAAYPHLWSLAVEEQFYLLWPLLLILSGRYRVPLVIATIFIAAVCAVTPALQLRGWLNNGLAVYCLSAGVLFALSGKFRRAFDVVRPIPTIVLAIALLVVSSFGIARFGSLRPVGLIILPLLIVAAVLARDGKVIAPLRQIGLISYSLYLWHWLATLPSYASPWAALASWLALPAAILSYRYIEQPLIRLGQRWSKAISATGNAAAVEMPSMS